MLRHFFHLQLTGTFVGLVTQDKLNSEMVYLPSKTKRDFEVLAVMP